jgi:hypothetical protein
VNESDLSQDWSQSRWISILDRIEHRQSEVGLRFWGPPLWLEVTMSGPDSVTWFANPSYTQEWNWQSSAPCHQVAALAKKGADDNELLAVVSRYAIENLILNSVHEIGEWFRFDGERLFPAHPTGDTSVLEVDEQGNGAVELQVTFGQDTECSDAVSDGQSVDPVLLQRLEKICAGPRFTYLPNFTISFEAAGPVIQMRTDGRRPIAWRSVWSPATLEAATDDEQLVMLAGRDVHRGLVCYEADNICRAFHIDGRRPWRLASPKAPLGSDVPDLDAKGTELLALRVTYAEAAAQASMV